MMLRALSLVVLVAIGPSTARAQARQEGDLAWRDSYRRASWIDAAVIAGGSALYLGDMWLVPRRTEAIWHGPVLWDDPLRQALRLHVRGQRQTAETVSDYLFTGSLLHNLVFDNLLVAWVVHGEFTTAFQLSAINLEAYAVSASLTGFVKTLAGRERPFARECQSDANYSELCGAPTSYRAFFSAHAATTAVGAGLLCAHHTHLPLYDGGVLDLGACVTGIGLTLATGALRIASDNHWSTDVTTGHLVGFASGYLIPTLFYYRGGGATQSATRTTVILPSVSPQGAGAQVVGLW